MSFNELELSWEDVWNSVNGAIHSLLLQLLYSYCTSPPIIQFFLPECELQTSADLHLHHSNVLPDVLLRWDMNMSSLRDGWCDSLICFTYWLIWSQFSITGDTKNGRRWWGSDDDDVVVASAWNTWKDNHHECRTLMIRNMNGGGEEEWWFNGIWTGGVMMQLMMIFCQHASCKVPLIIREHREEEEYMM